MTTGPIESYRPRAVTELGLWSIDGLQLKVYGIAADRKEITDSTINFARSFVSDEVPPLVAAEGDDNGLGFVIIHPGDLGLSVLAHWWIQGSVLCQHIHRTLWDAAQPLNTLTRPAVACVWELGLIDAEQKIWRKTMMKADADASAYLETWADMNTV